MRRLVYYESRKHFLTKPMFFMVLLLLVVNAIKIFDVTQEQSPFSTLSEHYFREAYDKLYEIYKGELTDEKLEDIMALYQPLSEKVAGNTYSTEAEEGSMTYNTFSDCLFMEWCFMKDIKYETGYEDYANHVVKNAVENVSFYKSKNNLFEAKANYNIAKAFYQRKLTSFYNTDGFRALFYYDFSTIIIILLCLYGCSSVFIKEEETEMNLLLKTSLKGREASFTAKIMSCMLFVLFICILFSAEDYLLFWINFGDMAAFLEPIYMLEGFQDTLLNMSLISFYVLCVISRLIGIYAIAFLFMMVSLFGKNTLSVFVVNIASLAVIIGIYTANVRGLKYVNPLSLFFCRKLFIRQEFINLFDYPVCNSLFPYIFSGMIMIAAIALMSRRWKRG
ncbi:MAG: hypothetical protein HDR01_11425 [Lachnospiraceae bacterium]|nr:hypothetical protein [Lachnospiraceae bacterium]